MSDPAHVPEPTYKGDATEIDMRVLLRASDTGDTISLFEEITPIGKGPPLHIHHNADEFFRVLAGNTACESVIDIRCSIGRHALRTTRDRALFSKCR